LKGGPLLPEALKAFQEMRSYLCSKLVVDYPCKDCPYNFITYATLGDDKKPGVVGVILTQTNAQGKHSVLASAIRKLKKHGRITLCFCLRCRPPYAEWNISTYLQGQHFTLFTDHRPLEKLGKVHTNTLN
jgi:hypothetical protein